MASFLFIYQPYILISIVTKYLIAKEKREKRIYILLAQQIANYGDHNAFCGRQIMATLIKKPISVRIQLL